MGAISVKVTKFADRKFWLMYYDDPVTGKRVPRSTKQTTQREAERAAAKWEAELREGRYSPASNIEWSKFRERYEMEVLPSLAAGTATNCGTVFKALESAIKVRYLRDLTPERLSAFQSWLREKGKAEATIRSYLAQLKAVLKWGVDMQMIPAVPKVKMPARVKAGGKMMKGRPITGEEFERVLSKVEAGLLTMAHRVKPKQKPRRIQSQEAIAKRKTATAALVEAAAPSWRHLLRGLWLSGLRLGEALNLSWDEPHKLHVVLNGRRPMLRIHAGLEKGNKDRLLPVTPDFAELLLATPQSERIGPVFRPLGTKGRGEVRNSNYASKVIAAMGKAAGVKVDQIGSGKVKYATAHDLRRSFGARWATRVMPAVLQQLMRHESIETTMRFYVGQNSEATADAVWAAFERVNTFVNSRPVPSTKVEENTLN